jgi:hypothetical protein
MTFFERFIAEQEEEMTKLRAKLERTKTLYEAPKCKKYYKVFEMDDWGDEETPKYFYNKATALKYMKNRIEGLKKWDLLEYVCTFNLSLEKYSEEYGIGSTAIKTKFDIYKH